MSKITKNLTRACSALDNLSALLTTLALINDTTTIPGPERRRLVRNVIDIGTEYTEGILVKLSVERDMLDDSAVVLGESN